MKPGPVSRPHRLVVSVRSLQLTVINNRCSGRRQVIDAAAAAADNDADGDVDKPGFGASRKPDAMPFDRRRSVSGRDRCQVSVSVV